MEGGKLEEEKKVDPAEMDGNRKDDGNDDEDDDMQLEDAP